MTLPTDFQAELLQWLADFQSRSLQTCLALVREDRMNPTEKRSMWAMLKKEYVRHISVWLGPSNRVECWYITDAGRAALAAYQDKQEAKR